MAGMCRREGRRLREVQRRALFLERVDPILTLDDRTRIERGIYAADERDWEERYVSGPAVSAVVGVESLDPEEPPDSVTPDLEWAGKSRHTPSGGRGRARYVMDVASMTRAADQLARASKACQNHQTALTRRTNPLPRTLRSSLAIRLNTGRRSCSLVLERSARRLQRQSALLRSRSTTPGLVDGMFVTSLPPVGQVARDPWPLEDRVRPPPLTVLSKEMERRARALNWAMARLVRRLPVVYGELPAGWWKPIGYVGNAPPRPVWGADVPEHLLAVGGLLPSPEPTPEPAAPDPSGNSGSAGPEVPTEAEVSRAETDTGSGGTGGPGLGPPDDPVAGGTAVPDAAAAGNTDELVALTDPDEPGSWSADGPGATVDVSKGGDEWAGSPLADAAEGVPSGTVDDTSTEASAGDAASVPLLAIPPLVVSATDGTLGTYHDITAGEPTLGTGYVRGDEAVGLLTSDAGAVNSPDGDSTAPEADPPDLAAPISSTVAGADAAGGDAAGGAVETGIGGGSSTGVADSGIGSSGQVGSDVGGGVRSGLSAYEAAVEPAMPPEGGGEGQTPDPQPSSAAGPRKAPEGQRPALRPAQEGSPGGVTGQQLALAGAVVGAGSLGGILLARKRAKDRVTSWASYRARNQGSEDDAGVEASLRGSR